MDRFYGEGFCLPLGKRTYTMGILNVTPDSFSDGGKWFNPDAAAAHALEMQAHGADLLDLGAQSTRPGHVEIPPEQELARLAPVLERLKGNLHIPISIDTYYPQVAQKALELGAQIINDVSGRFSEQMAQVIRSHGAGWIVMHTGGGTADTQEAYPEGVTANVRAFFQTMAQQAERFGAKSAYAQVERMDLTASPKVLETSEGTFHARTVVLATGANPRELGLPHEAALTGRGIAYCAACDGMRYKGKTVAVVGGGNSAAGDALLLSRIAERVVLVHRRDQLRATKIYHEPLIQAENVEFRWNSTVTELLHEEKLTGIRLRDVQTGAESVLPCDGLFISVGRKPATELVKGQLELDAGGYVTADETTRTNLPGVYAVGDVRTKPLRQVVTAVADGAMAVHMAEEYLAGGA